MLSLPLLVHATLYHGFFLDFIQSLYSVFATVLSVWDSLAAPFNTLYFVLCMDLWMLYVLLHLLPFLCHSLPLPTASLLLAIPLLAPRWCATTLHDRAPLPHISFMHYALPPAAPNVTRTRNTLLCTCGPPFHLHLHHLSSGCHVRAPGCRVSFHYKTSRHHARSSAFLGFTTLLRSCPAFPRSATCRRSACLFRVLIPHMANLRSLPPTPCAAAPALPRRHGSLRPSPSVHAFSLLPVFHGLPFQPVTLLAQVISQTHVTFCVSASILGSAWIHLCL